MALAAAAELTPPFLVLSEPANLPQSPALKKFAKDCRGGEFYGLYRDGCSR